jgi:GAF domain-containing protein
MASSSERTDALDLLRSQNEEVPCFECYLRGEPVVSHNLEVDAGRWSAFAPAAVRRGFCSVHALPMRVRGETIGALSMFRADAGLIAEEDLSLGQGMADIAAIALLQERLVRESRGVVTHAWKHNRRLADVARELIEGGLDAAILAAPATSPRAAPQPRAD